MSIHNVNGTNTLCNSMYSDYMQNVNIAGCAYSLANNPNSGRFEVNVGMVTPDKLTSSSHNGNQNVSLNSNCTVARP